MKKKEVEMQKLFVKGHLKIDADITSKHIENFLLDLGPVCGMNVFFGPVVKSPDLYDHETWERLGKRPPEDVNAVIMWDDSGVQMYIFPTKDNWFTIDIYTCKKFNTDKVLSYITDVLDTDDDVEFATQTANTFTTWQLYQGAK